MDYIGVLELIGRRSLDECACLVWIHTLSLACYAFVKQAGHPLFRIAAGFVIFLVAVISFARVYYPHIRSYWGGGKPILATLVLSKDVPINSVGPVQVWFFDESTVGFYVMGPNDRGVTFIPRTSVSAIYFSNNQHGYFLPTTKH